jgi:transcription initiation factor TFIID subunit 6
VEGVQPSIPQNPTASNHADLLPKGPNANPHMAAANGLDNVSIKPLVKHVLSKESQELFAKLSSALLDETNPEWQNAALASIQSDPGIHQLVTYLLTFIAEKVTHSMKNIFVLRSMLQATEKLLANPTIYLDPYIPYMVPPVLTCCTGKHLGPTATSAPSNASSETLNGNGMNGHRPNQQDHFQIRELAASLLQHICSKYSASNQNLKMRISRICLKSFLDPNKPLGTHYGALRALRLIARVEGTRMLVLPNLKIYDEVLKEALAEDSKRQEVDRVLAEILQSLDEMARTIRPTRVNGVANLEGQRLRLVEKVGEVIADRLVASRRTDVVAIILETDLGI